MGDQVNRVCYRTIMLSITGRSNGNGYRTIFKTMAESHELRFNQRSPFQPPYR